MATTALKTSPKDDRPALDVQKTAAKVREVANQRPLCIWHKGCLDGFTSAWVVRNFFGHDLVEFHPGVYGEPPPDVTDRNVLMVDFSYKRDVIEEMRKTARAILILDHHKTAEADLKEYQPPADKIEAFPYFPSEGECVAFFDMARSGAGLCWDFFFPGMARPKFINHIEDRDLWRFKLPGTKELNTLAYSYDFDFFVWDRMVETAENLQGFEIMVTQGQGLERQRSKDCEALISEGKTMRKICGVEMPLVSAPWFYASEIGNMLSNTHDCKCGATYYDRGDGKRVYSLRSIDGGPDVSEIAKKMGGGGHAHAAGFTVPHKEEQDVDPQPA